MSIFEISVTEELTKEQAQELLEEFEEVVAKKGYYLNHASYLDEHSLEEEWEEQEAEEEEDEEDPHVVCCPGCGYEDELIRMFDRQTERFRCPECRMSW